MTAQSPPPSSYSQLIPPQFGCRKIVTQRNGPRHATCSARQRLYRHFTSILRVDLTGEFPVSDVAADGRVLGQLQTNHRLRKGVVRSVRPRVLSVVTLQFWPDVLAQPRGSLPLRLYLEPPRHATPVRMGPPNLAHTQSCPLPYLSPSRPS